MTESEVHVWAEQYERDADDEKAKAEREVDKDSTAYWVHVHQEASLRTNAQSCRLMLLLMRQRSPDGMAGPTVCVPSGRC